MCANNNWWLITTSTLMLEIEEVSKMLDFKLAIMWQTPWEPLRKYAHHESLKPYVKKNW